MIQNENNFVNTYSSFDDLINDELGRKLFSYYLKQRFENDDGLMLYLIFKRLVECNDEERRENILKCTYNKYFKFSNRLILMILNDLNEILCFKLENKQYDFSLILEAKKRLKLFLEFKCYNHFLTSEIYAKFSYLLMNEQFLLEFFKLNNSDEQVKLLIEISLNESLYQQFNFKSISASPIKSRIQSSSNKISKKTNSLTDSSHSKK